MRIGLTLLFVLLCAARGSAQSSSVPFQLFDNRILVDCTIDGVPGFAMIFDTGSTGVLVTPEAAQRLHLQSKQGGAITGAGSGSLPVTLTHLHDFAIGETHFGALPAIVGDLSTIRRAFGFPRLDGVVGYDVLGSREVLVDMDRRVFTISSHALQAPRNARRVGVVIRDGLWHVPAAIDGKRGTVIVDTGDRSSLTLFNRFAQAHGYYAVPSALHDVLTGYGVGGPIYADVFRTTLSAFGTSVSQVLTRAQRGAGGVFATSTEAGSIGNGFLRRFNIIYDAGRGSMTLWPSHYFSDVDQYRPLQAAVATTVLARHGVFGAAVVEKAAGVTVMRVIPGSAAAAANVKPGDVIKGIGGVDTPTVASFLAAVHTFHAGQTVAVAILRNGSPLQMSATLGRPAAENDPDVTTLYQAIEVDGSLRRTLVTVPKNATSRLPAVLLIGGIGCYSVDAATDPNDAYMRVTHDLSRARFVTMRLEKSGVGDSQGPPCSSVDFLTEERSYGAALTALRNDPHVDPNRVYLLGHSIGSVIAPRLASTQRVAGVIVAEAVGRDWLEYETRNARRQLELTGASPADVDAKVVEKQECMYRLLVQKEPEAAIERTMPACKEPNSVYPVDAAYVQQVAALNIIQPWTRLNVPALVIYGKSDFVTEEADHARIVQVVNAAHPQNATLVSIDGMDHMLFRAPTPKAAMEAFQNGAAREYDTDFSRAIIAWLSRQH